MERSAVEVTVTRGDAALARLGSSELRVDWGRLHATCPWSTSFQSAAFVECWYRLHDHLYEPVVVEGRDPTGRLVGLLTLARRRSGQHLVGAGDIHAEYQGWIAEPAASETFVRSALTALERAFPRGRLRFNYLAPGTPVDWIGRDNAVPRRIHVVTRQRGLIDLSDGSDIEASLRKGHNRSRLNHLRRSGEVVLETIDTPDALNAVIDEIAVLCDLRQGAVNNSLPFTSNPLKRPLHLALMEQGLLLVTVLRVGGAIASAHLDMRNGDEVLVYLIAHAPRFARDSPGSLHILMLARDLAQHGVTRYDLSPGTGYKDRYATERQPIHRLIVRFGMGGRVAGDISARAVSIATKALAATGRTPVAARNDALAARARIRQALVPGSRPKPADDKALILRVPGAAGGAPVDQLALDRLGDLLAYDESRSGGVDRQAFLQLALLRLELGHRALTRTRDGCLIECWWARSLAVGAAAPGRRNPSSPPPGALLLYDPLGVDADGTDAAAGVMGRVELAAQLIAPGATTYVALPARHQALGRALGTAGAVVVGEVAPASDDGSPDVTPAEGAQPVTATLLEEISAVLSAAAHGSRRSG